jgi:hypothetical protein
MLGEAGAAVTPPAAQLVSAVRGTADSLRKALDQLDRSFHSDGGKAQAIKDVKAAIQECSQHAPDLLERLKQHIEVRCAINNLDKGKVFPAMGGGPKKDAYYFRLWARTMELSEDPRNLLTACTLWENFRQNAMKEGWFPPDGLEAATLYLHIAGILGNLPLSDLKEFQRVARTRPETRADDEEIYFLFPEKLYQRACALDPHFDAFSKWLAWAKGKSGAKAEPVAKTWHAARPNDIEPILHLMNECANRSAFPTALQYLAKAELIDSVNPEVRRARLQLLARGTVKHLQQKKPHLARRKLAELEGLPQSQQGDRPAFLATLRYLISKAEGDIQTAEAHRGDTERLMGGKIAAWLLRLAVATAAKYGWMEQAVQLGKLNKQERAAIPAGVARVFMLAGDLDAFQLSVPWPYLNDACVQLPRVGASLDTNQLQALADAGLANGHRELAYVATRFGLDRGGPSQARFLLLRGKSVPDALRAAICASAAAELARTQRGMELVEEAVEFCREAFAKPPVKLSLEQVAQIIRKERSVVRYSRFEGDGPDYERFLPDTACQCPECRGARGGSGNLFDDAFPFDDPEDPDDFEEDELLDELLEEFPLPPGMPPDIAKALVQEARRAVMNGEPLDAMLNRVFGGLPPRRGSRKGRRR